MKTIGIIGGMGPLATIDLYHRIVELTPARSDAEHVPTVIDSNTRIPDRTASILAGGESPVKELVRSAKRLEAAGADILLIACNTAHYYYDEVQAATKTKVLNMPRITAKYVKDSGMKRVMLLSTTGTVKAGVYGKAFELCAPGVQLLCPNEEGGAILMDVIYRGIKAGNVDFDPERFRWFLSKCREEGAESFVLGCTEMPLAFERYGVKEPCVDPTLLLAKEAVRLALE